MSRLSGKNKDNTGSFKSESDSSVSSTDGENESDIEEEVREETPDLYRNSALGMYGGVSLFYFMNRQVFTENF